MHYANGREAKVGDLVKGRYEGVAHDIIGIVTFLSGGSDICNCTVHAVIRAKGSTGWGSSVFAPVALKDGAYQIAGSNFEVKAIGLTANCKDFVALDPETGEVLPMKTGNY